MSCSGCIVLVLLVLGAMLIAASIDREGGFSTLEDAADLIAAVGGAILIGLAVIIWQLGKIYGLLLERHSENPEEDRQNDTANCPSKNQASNAE
jgi:hypothetical protein